MKWVEVETLVEVWVIVSVSCRGISPATAGPARSAEMATLAIILRMLMYIVCLGVRFEEFAGLGCYG